MPSLLAFAVCALALGASTIPRLAAQDRKQAEKQDPKENLVEVEKSRGELRRQLRHAELLERYQELGELVDDASAKQTIAVRIS